MDIPTDRRMGVRAHGSSDAKEAKQGRRKNGTKATRQSDTAGERKRRERARQRTERHGQREEASEAKRAGAQRYDAGRVMLEVVCREGTTFNVTAADARPQKPAESKASKTKPRNGENRPPGKGPLSALQQRSWQKQRGQDGITVRVRRASHL